MFHINNNHDVGGNNYVTLENILFSSLQQEEDEHYQQHLQDQHYDDDDQTDNDSETTPILMMSSSMRMNHDYNSFQREKQQKHASSNDDGTCVTTGGGATSTPNTSNHSWILGSIVVLLLAMDVSLRLVSILRYYDMSSNQQQLSMIVKSNYNDASSRSDSHQNAGDDGCSSSTTTSRQNRRWVPVRDILNTTMTSDKSDTTTLKYATDIQNSAKNGLQGLAYDNGANMLYQVHTMSVRVLQLSEANDDNDDNNNNNDNNMIQINSILKTRMYTPDDFPLLEQNLTVTHIGGIDLALSHKHGQELWMAVHSDGIHGVGGIVAVDTSTLLPKHDRKVLTSVNIDWVVYNNGILYYGGFFNVHSIRRVQLDTLQELPDLVLDCTNYTYMDLSGGLNYIQSGAFDDQGRLVLLGDDYQSTIYYFDVESGHILSHQGLLVGGETDGITFYNPPKSKNNKQRRRNKHTTSSPTTSSSSMLVGLNRLHSHEQVMGDEPMVSIIQLEQLR